MKAEAPPARNLAQEGRESLEAQIELAGPQYEATAEYAPKYVDLEIQKLRQALLGSGEQPGLLATYEEIAPLLGRMATEASRQQRTQDVEDVEALGGRAVAAIRSADPITAALEDALAAQADEELAAGASMDPTLANEVAQGVRAGQAARGFGFGAPDVVVEAYSRGARGDALRRARQAFAQSVVAQRRASATDPFLAVVGRQSSVPGMVPQVAGQGGAAGATGPSFDPFSSYAQNLFAQNYATEYDVNKSNASMGNALIGSGISALGSVGGAFL